MTGEGGGNASWDKRVSKKASARGRRKILKEQLPSLEPFLYSV
jgi:hypothetical protein